MVKAKDLDSLAANAHKAASFLKAMSNENRLMILCCLLDQEYSVGALNERVPLSQSALSQHLAALRKAGLVQIRRESQTIYYRLEADMVKKIIQILSEHFCAHPFNERVSGDENDNEEGAA